jgi:hypothetical protein
VQRQKSKNAEVVHALASCYEMAWLVSSNFYYSVHRHPFHQPPPFGMSAGIRPSQASHEVATRGKASVQLIALPTPTTSTALSKADTPPLSMVKDVLLEKAESYGAILLFDCKFLNLLRVEQSREKSWLI